MVVFVTTINMSFTNVDKNNEKFNMYSWSLITTKNNVDFYGRWTNSDGQSTWHIRVVNRNTTTKYVGCSRVEFYDSNGALINKANGGGKNVKGGKDDESFDWYGCSCKPYSGKLIGIEVTEPL